MKIEMRQDACSQIVSVKIEIPREFMVDECEPYGSPEMCDLITCEQGIGIIEDAVLMALHLKRKPNI